MSDTELRDLLVEVADQAVPVNLIPYVRLRLRARRRRRHTVAALSTMAGVGAVTYGGVQLAGAGGPAATAVQTPSPVGDPVKQATTSVTPSYLPPGVRLGSTGPVALPKGIRPRDRLHPTLESWYRLPGVKNANTTPRGGVSGSQVGDLRFHPSTDLEITFVPRSNLGPNPRLTGSASGRGPMLVPPLDHGRLARQRVTIAGNPAIITLDKNQHGAFRVDWLDADGYHHLGCDRLVTPQGLSGLGLHAMLRIARSLYGR